MNLGEKLFDFDQWLIARCEARCQRVQRFTGKSNYFWLRCIAYIHCAMCVVVQLHEMQKGGSTFIIVMAGFWALFYFAYGVWLYGVMEKGAVIRIERKLANPFRHRAPYVMVRICVGYPNTLVLIFALVHAVLFDQSGQMLLAALLLWWGGSVLSVVLIACDPLPPTKGKVKEWLRSLFTSRVAVPSPT